MSKRTNPAVVGAFVVGAVLLLTLGFVLFGGTQLFANKSRYVTYFDETTAGLRTGANVLMNGVRIGYVSDIDLLFDQADFNTLTQVTIEILEESYVITEQGKFSNEVMSSAIDHDTLINTAGMRARLDFESFVTGQLWVVLELRPDSEAVFRGVEPPYPEIPTMSSNISEILTGLQDWLTEIQQDVDLKALSASTISALNGVGELARSADLRKTLAGIGQFVSDDEFRALAGDLQTLLAQFGTAADDARALFKNTEGNIESLAEDMSQISERLDKTLAEAESTLGTARQRLRGDSEELYRLNATLEELERAARAAREFFDYIERNPEALIQGKSR